MCTGKRLTTWILPNILAGLFLSAVCTTIAANQVQEVTLTLGDYRFTPDMLEVYAGRPVRLTLNNTDSITPHNFIIDDREAGLEIDIDVSAGKTGTVEFTPASPGRHTFYCSKKLPFMKSHREKGMEGTLVVR